MSSLLSLARQVTPRRSPPRTVLGLSALAHDPAAALISDGRIIGAVEEERLNREKDTCGFPHRSIHWLLEHANIKLEDVDAIAFYWDDWGLFPQTMLHSLPFGLRFAASRARCLLGPHLLREQLASLNGGRKSAIPPIIYVPHHHAHLSAARNSAPFSPGAGLVIDGRGEYAATSLFSFREATGGPVPSRLIEELTFPNSLGVFYGAMTQVLGYRPLADEYKVMGLASYGQKDAGWESKVARLLAVRPDGTHKLDPSFLNVENCTAPNMSWLNAAGLDLFASTLRSGASFTAEAKDLAWAVQQRLEHALIELAKRLVRLAGSDKMVLTGGVAMNACAVGALRRSGVLSDLHVPLAPYDSGACIGAAVAVLEKYKGKIPAPAGLVDPFLGPASSDDEVEALLSDCGWHYRRCNPAEEGARLIAEGKTIGWFQGRLEFGARALGARSILGDPRFEESRERINRSVKRRESYRPFAPAVLEEHASEYFDVTTSRLMGEVVLAKELAKKRVPAVVHIDGTARPQTVPRDSLQVEFRKLIEHFHELAGVPMVVNTSFNVRGEPIVCSAEDAVRCFAASGLDCLIMGPFIVRKRLANE